MGNGVIWYSQRVYMQCDHESLGTGRISGGGHQAVGAAQDNFSQHKAWLLMSVVFSVHRRHMATEASFAD